MPPRVITIATQKGGVGKTTLAVNLAAAMAGHLGLRTYLADFDAQCNATSYVLGHIPQDTRTIRDVLMESAPFGDCAIVSPHCPELRVLAGSPELAYLDRQVAESGKWQIAARELPRVIRRSIPEDADVVIVDTPPSLGLWLQIALGASDYVAIPANPEEFSLQGMVQLFETVQHIQQTLNPRLQVAALLINKVRANTNEHGAYIDAFRHNFGSSVLSPVLPMRTVIPESQREHVPVEFYPSSNADTRGFFRDLARELLEQVGVLSPAPSRVAAV